MSEVEEIEIFTDTEFEQKANSVISEIPRSTTPTLALDTGELSIEERISQSKPPLIPFKFLKEYKRSKIPNWKKTPNQISKPKTVKYQRIAKDIVLVQGNSKQTSYYCKPYSDILRNQLVRAHSHSLLEFAFKFEEYRKKNPYNKDPTWFLEKAAADLFVFSDELQGVSNLPQANRLIGATDFEELAQPASVGPFIGFIDPRNIIETRSKKAFH